MEAGSGGKVWESLGRLVFHILLGCLWGGALERHSEGLGSFLS